jgi:hypothetical protein
MLRRIAQALILVGLVGFLGTIFVIFFPYAFTWLDRVELPTFFETYTIGLPDGGRLTATVPAQRVQRYGSDGRFRTGWFVDGKGGSFAIGLTSDGRIAICTARTHEMFFFDPDGRRLGHQACPGPSVGLASEVHILRPADFPVDEVHLQPAASVERPNASLVPILLVPFWHPFAAWLMLFIGIIALRFGRSAA